ncbi:MAG: oligoribonuclease [Actinomycetaceae bacterium]|nr:oligoribonuclease [Actinomycetaceae bacterium]
MEYVSKTQSFQNPIVWIDCEMTGLDPSIDELVEISVVVTDHNLEPLDEGIDYLIRPSKRAVDNMNSFVRRMHTNSGLINEWNDGISCKEAEKHVLSYIKKYVPDAKKAHLGGNSIGTDRIFLSTYMPSIIDYLHYRIIDVSTIKELAKRWYQRAYIHAPEKTGNHRALGDIYDSIDELRYYRSVLFPSNADDITSEQCKTAAHDATGATLTKAKEQKK